MDSAASQSPEPPDWPDPNDVITHHPNGAVDLPEGGWPYEPEPQELFLGFRVEEGWGGGTDWTWYGVLNLPDVVLAALFYGLFVLWVICFALPVVVVVWPSKLPSLMRGAGIAALIAGIAFSMTGDWENLEWGLQLISIGGLYWLAASPPESRRAALVRAGVISAAFFYPHLVQAWSYGMWFYGGTIAWLAVGPLAFLQPRRGAAVVDRTRQLVAAFVISWGTLLSDQLLPSSMLSVEPWILAPIAGGFAMTGAILYSRVRTQFRPQLARQA